MSWLGDNRTLLVHTVPAGRGAPPADEAMPQGPHVQESLGHAGPAPTFEDLLSTPHDEDLFEYYSRAQLAYVDAASGKITPFGKPAIFTVVRVSPDQKHVLIGYLRKPYSYQLPYEFFPEDVEVWDRGANLELKLASLPLAERVPLAGVRIGPRAIQWLPESSATLTWAEALDHGDPKEAATYRDKILVSASPFHDAPREVFKTPERFREFWPLAGGKALVEDYERKQRVVRTLEIDLERPSTEARVIFKRNERDEYHDPGTPLFKTTPDGRRTVVQSGDDIYLIGLGASPSGDHPFLDRFNLATGKAERLYQNKDGYEAIVAMLDDTGSRLLTRQESPTDPPELFLPARAGHREASDSLPESDASGGGDREKARHVQTRGRGSAFVHAVSPAELQAGPAAPDHPVGVSVRVHRCRYGGPSDRPRGAVVSRAQLSSARHAGRVCAAR